MGNKNRNKPETVKIYLKKYLQEKPWVKHLISAYSRCSTKKHPYYKKGIKCFLTVVDLETLWFRDKAYLMKEPSIDRIDARGNYTFKNCRFIERIENCREGGFNRWKKI